MKTPQLRLLIILVLMLQACSQNHPSIDLQGHRGCRGDYPENTVAGFLAAMEAGVTTLEMDVVISKDKQVVLSHEPYFSHEIALTPIGEEITEENEKQYNLYELTYEEIARFDVGQRNHPRFPNQKKMEASKPLLSEVIAKAESFAKDHHLKQPFYNIEIKRTPAYDSIFHPGVNEFVDLVLAQVADKSIADRVCIQSFDIETLQRVKAIKPNLTLALLIENKLSFEQNLQNLGFDPEIYSPSFELVNEALIVQCAARNIKVIPWTVNQEADVLRMINLDVDGIITDYPGLVKEMLTENGISIEQ
ncbi:MAG: glycerophosphodiester phosphodiesterase [Salibacteraceae bacterium]|nr:glycerophosphodiester phosphodiesterase [Salibacteraceae bacterium]